MNRLVIRKTHANAVFEAIRRLELDPQDFEWQVVPSPGSRAEQEVSKLTHIPTTFYFIFDYVNEQHYCHRSPAPGVVRDSQYPGDWPGQFRCVQEWLDELAKEYRAPDLWEAVGAERQIAEAAARTDENEPFDEETKERIRSFVRELDGYIRTTHELDATQSDFLERRLLYLEEAADRQGRQDWLHTLVGVLFTIVMGILGPETAGDLFRTAAQLLATYLHTKGFLP